MPPQLLHRIPLAALPLLLALLAGCGDAPPPPEGILDWQTFRCYAASESMRTVTPARIEHKKIQLRRMRRLLDTHRLDARDEAKLRAELAITLWDAEDARYLRACAEAYYQPGSAHARTTFDQTPVAFRTDEAAAAFRAAAEVEPRLLPHGFSDRAQLHQAEIALHQRDLPEAERLARARLDDEDPSLYEATYQIILADALLARGARDEAAALYEDAGRLKIGAETYYARYRLSVLLRAQGRDDEAQALLDDVLQWARRGDREVLTLVLKGGVVPAPR